MKAQIPWLRVFIEGVVIVGSILLAFGIDAWWDEGQERRGEQEVLTSLQAEFEENVDLLDAWIGIHHRVDVATERFLDLLSEMPEGQRVSVPDSIVAQAIRGPTYQPIRASLDAALSSGQIELIASTELQRNLATWSRLLAEASEEEQGGRRATAPPVSRYRHFGVLPNLY